MIIAFQVILLFIIAISFFGVIGEDEQTPENLKGKFVAMHISSVISYFLTLILF